MYIRGRSCHMAGVCRLTTFLKSLFLVLSSNKKLCDMLGRLSPTFHPLDKTRAFSCYGDKGFIIRLILLATWKLGCQKQLMRFLQNFMGGRWKNRFVAFTWCDSQKSLHRRSPSVAPTLHVMTWWAPRWDKSTKPLDKGRGNRVST